jgi:tRNA A-37 threonylcarbamoyl transferase component Bud32
MVGLRLRRSSGRPRLLELPWDKPLESWPDNDFVRLPAGTHRHVVRFLKHDGEFYALKELPPRLARREFENIDRLRTQGLPAVTLIGIATDRTTPDGEPLESVLITRHLAYSLPYRAVFTDLSNDSQRRQMIDALAVLLVRLHIGGFFWGDCSLNNVLFRRDAGSLRAYVVDTETSEFHDQLSDGQRAQDIEIAVFNIAGGLFDLQAEGRLSEDIEPGEVVDGLVERYEVLLADLTAAEEVPVSELGRIQARLERLNALGFDAEEYELREESQVVRFRPTVVEEGYHKRGLERLTGIVAHENQARRLLNAIRGYGAWIAQTEGDPLPEATMGFRWMSERWHPALQMIPQDLRGKLEDAELYHELLEHNWFLSEQQGREVSLFEAVNDYVTSILTPRADERHVLPSAEE